MWSPAAFLRGLANLLNRAAGIRAASRSVRTRRSPRDRRQKTPRFSALDLHSIGTRSALDPHSIRTRHQHCFRVRRACAEVLWDIAGRRLVFSHSIRTRHRLRGSSAPIMGRGGLRRSIASCTGSRMETSSFNVLAATGRRGCADEPRRHPSRLHRDEARPGVRRHGRGGGLARRSVRGVSRRAGARMRGHPERRRYRQGRCRHRLPRLLRCPRDGGGHRLACVGPHRRCAGHALLRNRLARQQGRPRRGMRGRACRAWMRRSPCAAPRRPVRRAGVRGSPPRRRSRHAAGLRLVCVDSISLVVEGEDEGQIVLSGSHGGLVASQPHLVIRSECRGGILQRRRQSARTAPASPVCRRSMHAASPAQPSPRRVPASAMDAPPTRTAS